MPTLKSARDIFAGCGGFIEEDSLMSEIEKKDLDWANLPFAYMHTDYSYVCNYKDGKWDEGGLTPDHDIKLSECAGIFH